jgi:Response regulator containing CheY-like receiver domain and AraC-type DNA-binding domain
MAEKTVNEKKLRYMEFLSRESGTRHHTDAEDMHQYELLRAGDPAAVKEAVQIFSSNLPGHISDDPLRNYKYLFVAAITLASRTAIASGMEAERAYNISDLYILKMDRLESVDAVKTLHAEMFAFYAREIAELDKKNIYSKPIVLCLDYIYEHLHEPIRLAHLAGFTGHNASYLSTLFQKEMGIPISDYILSKRIEAAKNMLKYSTYSYAEIGATLAFSSQSHFTRAFKQRTGYTPKAYRNHFFRP